MDALPASLPNPGLPQPASAATAGLAILLAELSQSLAQAIAKLPPNTPLTALVTQVLSQPSAGETTTPSPASTALPATIPPTDPGAAKSQQPGTLVQISTPDGAAQIRVPPQIPVTPGATLEIQVNPLAQPQQWRLLTVDSRPATPAGLAPAPATPAPPSTTPATPAPAVAATASVPVKAPPQGISATLVTSSDPALPSGTTLLVRITGLTPAPQPSPASAPIAEEESPEPLEAPLPSPASAPTTSVAPDATAAPAMTAAPVVTTPPDQPNAAPAPEQPAVQPATPAGTQAPAMVQETSAPAPAIVGTVAPPPAPASTPAPQLIDGQVLPNTDAGKPLVRTSIGLMSLDTGPQSLPPDATVTLQVVDKPVPPPAFTPVMPPPDDPLDQILPKHLSHLIQAAQASPEDGSAVADQVREKIPAPGARLAAQLLSAISTAAQPDGVARFFGGDLTAALAHAAPQALEALSRHWETASAAVQGPGDGDWRALMIPFMIGGEIANLRLTVRQRQGKMAAAEREKGTRFLLDLDLSRLGPMQLDGLVKRQHKRFDLIIRSHAPLSGEMRRDIDALFIAGLVNFGLEGSVFFKPDGRFVTTPRLTGTANGIVFA